MTDSDAVVVGKFIGDTVKRAIADLEAKHASVLVDLAATQSQCCVLDAQCRELETRVAAFEAKPFVKFKGVYEAGASYAIGEAVTDHGSLWICRAATVGRPGTDHVAWQLAVKRGTA